jgi:hypothetical protein
MYVVGPIIAFGVVAGLAAVLRWTFDADVSTFPDRSDPEDFGLLRPVATVEDAVTARALRQTLSEAGIRATLGLSPDNRVHVLVFATELDRARRLVGGAI